MFLKKITFVLIITSCFSLLTSGCVSSLLGRSAGGNLVWWCDKCQSQVGSVRTHICGKTKFDSETGKDVPVEGVSEKDIEALLRKDEEARKEAQNDYEPENKEQKGFRFWRKNNTDKSNLKAESDKPSEGKTWKFWQKKAEQEAAKDAEQEATQQQNSKRKWKFWK